MNISFLNPWFLLGLPAVAIPIIIHLLSRKKTITHPFSYVKFIQLASVKVVRRYKLKQWFLLFLRTLLLLLLTILFARPIMHIAPIFARGRDTSLSTVLVLDNSYSMGYKDEHANRFDVGKDAAKRILRLMEKYDRTAFLLASNEIESGVKALTSDTDTLLDEIENSSLSSRPTNLLPAVSKAYSILKDSLSPNKQVILITDMAANGWTEVNEEAINKFDPRVKLIIIDLGKDDVSNLAVTGMEKGVMTTGQMLKIKADVRNFTDSNVSNLLVSLFIGRKADEIRTGKKVDQGFMKLPKNGKREKDFFYNFSEEGTYLGRIKIKEDNLAADDNYYFKVPVHEKIRVLCVDGEPGFSSFDKETFYLRLALDPYDKGVSIVPVIITRDELKNYKLSDFSVMIIANVKEFDDEIEDVYDFVKNGGGLLFFLGKNVKKDYYNGMLGSLLPARLLEVNEREPGWVIGYRDRKHPVLKIFSEEKQGNLSLARFDRWFKVQPRENSRVLLRLCSKDSEDKEHEGEPLLVESSLPYSKSGKIMLFASTVDREWNNFPAKPLFLPMLQQIISYLTEKPSDGDFKDYLTIGEPVKISFEPGNPPESVRLILPSGESENILPVSSKSFSEIEYKKADVPGVYTIEWTIGGRKRKEWVVYNLNMESGESDLAKIRMKEVKKHLQNTPVVLIDDMKELEKTLLNVLHGKEISKVMAVFLFGILILEGFVANRKRK